MSYQRLCLFILGLILFMNLANRLIDALITQDSKVILNSPAAVRQPALDNKPSKRIIVRSEQKRYPLLLDDPAQYGIISQSKDEIPRTQIEWDLFMEKAIVHSKVLEDENAKPAIEKMKKTPEEFQKREQEIDDTISLLKKRLEENPSDQEAHERLKTFRMLKALGKTIKDKVVTP